MTDNINTNDQDGVALTLVLVPLRGGPELGKEEIDPEFNSRPPLTLTYPSPSKQPKQATDMLDPDATMTRHKTSQGMSSLALGRNLLTRVYDTKLSRRLATMEFKKIPITGSGSGSGQNNQRFKVVVVLKVNQATATHKLCLNGIRVILEEVEVDDGDEICLHGDKYRYQVNIIENKSRPKLTPEEDFQAEVARKNGIILTRRNGNGYNNNIGNRQSIVSQCSQETASASSSESSSGASSRKRKRHESQLSSASSSLSSHGDSNPYPTQSRTQKIQQHARQQILEDMTCTICLEILVNTHVANPCGHVFCKSCIDKIPSIKKRRYESKSCPSCRKEISSLSWARSYDNVIWNMMLMGDVFGHGPHGEGDLREFMRRSGKKWKDLSEDERDCILRRCRRLDHTNAGSSGSGSGNHFGSGEGGQSSLQPGFHIQCREAAPKTLPSHGHGHDHTHFTNQYNRNQNHGNDEVLIVEAITAAGTVEDPICL